MRKSRKLRKSRKTHKRQRGGIFEGIFGNLFGKPSEASEKSDASKEPDASKESEASKQPQQNKNGSLPTPIGATTKVVNPTNGTTSGGMAPINMKEPMFYPTQRQLDWATTAGLPTKGGSRRRHMRNKKSKRKSRR